MSITPFHLAVPVRDIAEAREFYGVKMGFPEGRSTDEWIDFNMFGHQKSAYYSRNISYSINNNLICKHRQSKAH